MKITTLPLGPRLAAATLFASLALTAFVHAQVAPPASTPAAGSNPAAKSASTLTPAQVAAPASASTQAGDPAIQLSPFVVATDKDVGYLAANTLSGSRLNTPLYDTPASISELTKEFLLDINARNVTDALEYSLGFQNANPGGGGENNTYFGAGALNAVVRGLGTARIQSRDFFPISMNHDMYSMERISQSRGPNAILFGLGNAGGIVNSSSKRALFVPHRGEFLLSLDGTGGYRMAIDGNYKLSDKVAFRANLLNEDLSTWRESEYIRSKRYQLLGAWRPFKKTLVDVQYERGFQDRLVAYRYSGKDLFLAWVNANRPAYDRTVDGNTYPSGVGSVSNTPRLTLSDAGVFSNLQRFGQSVGDSSKVGFSGVKLFDETWMPFKAVLSGPAGTTDNNNWFSSIIVQQEVVRNFFVEYGYNEARLRRAVNTPIATNYGLRLDPNRTLPGGALNPNYGQFYVENQWGGNSRQQYGWHNQRLSLSYDWDSGNRWIGRHMVVGLGTRALDTFQAKVYVEANLTPLVNTGATRAFTNAQNQIQRRTYLSKNGAFGDNGNRSNQQDPEKLSPTVAFSDPVNGLSGTITPGFFLNNHRFERNFNQATMLAGQSKLLHGRLVVTYGLRRDTLDTQIQVLTRDPITNVVTSSKLGPVTSFEGKTNTFGGVVPITSWLAAYFNKSNNFSPQVAKGLTQEQLGNVRGEGEDYGLKISLGGNKLYARVGRFTSGATNQSELIFTYYSRALQIWEAVEGTTGKNYSVMDQVGQTSDTIDQVSRGYEFELTANPIKGLSLTANYARMEVKVENIHLRARAYVALHRPLWERNASLVIPSATDQTVASALIGIDNQIQADVLRTGNIGKQVPGDSINFFGKYDFQGERLKGWSIGGGVRYRGRTPQGYQTNLQPWYAPTNTLADARIGYRRRILEGRVGMNVQLNVSNVFDNTNLIITNFMANGTPDDYGLQTPRLFSLTTTFSF